jgi:TolA-binding protein
MKVYTHALLLLALGWSGCQAQDGAEDRSEIASLQKQVAALTRQIEETRSALAEMQDQQQQLSSSVQTLESTLATLTQLKASTAPAVLAEETLAPPGAESSPQAPTVRLSPAFPDTPGALPLKTRVACNEVWNLLGQGTSVAGTAKLLGATPEAVERCEKKIGRGGAQGG